MTEKPFDASDPKQVRQAKRDAGRQAKRDQQVIKNLMSSRDGRDWMWRWLEKYNVYGQISVPGDPYSTYFRDGTRLVAQTLLLEAQAADATLYLLMVKEAQEKSAAEVKSGDAETDDE